MSTPTRNPHARRWKSSARLFSALGDDTRLALLSRLSGGNPLSIAGLTQGSRLTRQAITKHLRVLQGCGLVTSVRHGREQRFKLTPQPLDHARRALDDIARQWDGALARLKAFVEES